MKRSSVACASFEQLLFRRHSRNLILEFRGSVISHVNGHTFEARLSDIIKMLFYSFVSIIAASHMLTP